MTSLFCIMIPVIYLSQSGKEYLYEDKYECFRSKEICEKRLSRDRYFLEKLQADKRLKKPHCSAEDYKISVDDKLSQTEEVPVVDESTWYKFW